MIWEKLEFSEEPQQQLKYESIEIFSLCKLFFGSLEEEWLYTGNFFTETFYFVFWSKLLRLNVGKLYSVNVTKLKTWYLSDLEQSLLVKNMKP